MKLDRTTAARFAAIALSHVTREYPNKLDHVMDGPGDVASPRALHPAFFGSFDWHSCVHSWWMLLTLRRMYPDMPEAMEIDTLAQHTLTAEALQAELAYAQRPAARSFERPYGWAWLLYLHLEARRHEDRDWAGHISPLAQHFAAGWRDYLATLAGPIRHGAHANTAFALTLTLEWARKRDTDLAELIENQARRFYGSDRDMRFAGTGGDEFLPPLLIEAVLMKRVLPPADFADWFAAFLPKLDRGEPEALFVPVSVTDPSDGKAAHLDGVNLTRAWCWRALDLGGGYAERHLVASLGAVDGHYMGSHWLASFATLAMLKREEAER
ncbi:DUF2891 domain-containing protein [Aurantiacibacter aquimixticola]|uniref:DUF2891 domain-containing protein n=1 Tax=Aurantiacibacter aquimixticola TaxID=1958945 RepID=A0A419RVM1_9SPHN|nr:DUF2891 domain-containing protein [Aurantiacibacter aquimixticola]RJY09828.1 DUF2891 domain-containing protein [Aurantiacibacter aquimixticola]